MREKRKSAIFCTTKLGNIQGIGERVDKDISPRGSNNQIPLKRTVIILFFFYTMRIVK